MPRPRPPLWLKRLVLPAYNGGYRLARTIGDHLRAAGRREFARCDCCGAFALMLLRRRAVADRLVDLWGLSPRLAEALRRKESLDCARCGAKLRARRIARALLGLHPVDPPARSLREWAGRPEARRLRLAELNRIDGLHEAVEGLPGLTATDYDETAPLGPRPGRPDNEDLTSLTYPDASFDLVVTSETLEHVPDLGAALAEIRRVLVPGGRHVFTVPLLPTVARTHPRAVVEPGGPVRDLAAPIRHPGGDVGYPVFTEFGADLPEILRAAGFEVDILFGPATEDDIAQVFVTSKPLGAEGSS